MGKVDYLWELQCLDGRERTLRRELENLAIKREIQELETRKEEKQRELAEVTCRLQRIEREIKAGEFEAGENERKGLELEQRLYSGETSSARELGQLQRRIAILKERGRELEERILALMLEQESLLEEEAKLGAVLRGLEGQLAAKQAVYAREAGELEQELALLTAEREELLPRIDKELLALYQRLSASKKGQAVAPVQGDLCLGCRLSLPTNIVSLIITNERLQTCPNCERILYYLGSK
ncbi:MAG TPA: hypothetical protein GX518_02420 [Firmicutes bacterium]|nr:hypothetical protein [Bacillota bacterium]